MPMPRRRPDLATGIEQDVPYDQTGLAGADTPQMASPGVGAPDPGAGAAPPPDAGGLGAMGDPSMAPPAGGGLPPDPTGGIPPSPEDLQVEQMAAALEDPNVPPQDKQQIEQQLALAARRQLAGLGQ